MDKKKPDFEQSIARLGEIVKHLEKGDAKLSDSLSLFEEGTALIANCESLLSEAEQKEVKLTNGAEHKSVELPFESWKKKKKVHFG